MNHWKIIIAIGLLILGAMLSPQGHLRVEAWTEDQLKDARQLYNWRCRILPNGGLVERKAQFHFEAAADGYNPSDEIVMPRTAAKWQSQAKRSLLALLIEDFSLSQNSFFPGGTSCAQISRWPAFKEVADSLLSALRCPLPLTFLLANGARLRRRMKVLRPNRPLQIESLHDLLLS